MDVKREISAYIENIVIILLGILFLVYPIIVTPLTTDPYVLPKQILLGGVSLIILLFLGVRMINEGTSRIRRTPFDIALGVFAIVVLLSSLFSPNRYDSAIAYVPLLFGILSYFLIVNFVRNQQSIFFVVVSFVAGACITSVLTILSFFNIYLLPFAFTKAQTFNTLGSVLDQLLYLVLVLPISIYLARPLVSYFGLVGTDSQKQPDEEILKAGGFLAAAIILIIGIGISIYELFVLKPGGGLVLLPFEVGFQTAFAAISQDAGRTLQGFLFGSGFGTYMIDFSRFKQAVPFNLNPTLWSLTFIRSSSFVLELLATTGIAGILSFGYLLFKIIQRVKIKKTRENVVFFAILFIAIASFFLPFSPILQAAFFLTLAIFAAIEGIKDQQNFYDVEFHFVAFKKGIIPFAALPVEQATPPSIAKIEDKSFTRALPIIFFLIFFVSATALSFISYRYVASDILFQDSLVAFAANDGFKTYNSQTNAINLFPYRDAYHRIYAQTNLALANSIASSQPKDVAFSPQTQQTILTLIQQSINAARNATTTSPLTALNWQNLSAIYRSLIGFGKDAQNFAIAAEQQAIAFDPASPQQYLVLGGIYYQLGQWEQAQQNFQRAISLKADFANAYYNYGHTLESKGDLPNALVYYQTVKTLVANDAASLKQIDNEIAALQEKIGTAEKTAPIKSAAKVAPAENQPPINVNTPTTQLPERKPLVDLTEKKASEAAK